MRDHEARKVEMENVHAKICAGQQGVALLTFCSWQLRRIRHARCSLWRLLESSWGFRSTPGILESSSSKAHQVPARATRKFQNSAPIAIGWRTSGLAIAAFPLENPSRLTPSSRWSAAWDCWASHSLEFAAASGSPGPTHKSHQSQYRRHSVGSPARGQRGSTARQYKLLEEKSFNKNCHGDRKESLYLWGSFSNS